jgi:DNA-binding PadR family transcriptional regulator
MSMPRLSAKETLILRLLVGKGEMYGLELVRESGAKLKRGTVYVTLGRMADKGYVDSREVSSGDQGKLPRRLFHATGLGARALHALEIAEAAWASKAIYV